MNSKIYDTLKWGALVALPALSVFWLAIAPIWGIPYGDQIGTTIIAVSTLLGTLVGVSSIQHAKSK